jgi:hypothetical protein
MISFEVTEGIDRPLPEVFNLLSNPGNDSLYREWAQSAEWVSDPPVLFGSTMRTVDRVKGREVETISEIRLWEPPHRNSFRTIGGSFPSEISMGFEPPETGTKLNSHVKIQFTGIMKLLEALLPGQIVNQAEEDFRKPRHLLESG